MKNIIRDLKEIASGLFLLLWAGCLHLGTTVLVCFILLYALEHSLSIEFGLLDLVLLFYGTIFFLRHFLTNVVKNK